MKKKSKKGKVGTDSENDSGSKQAKPAEKESTGNGGRKKVVAENGKVLLVDAIGNVFLEEQNKDGETEEFLLDIDEICQPTIKQTILFRLPNWLFTKVVSSFQKSEKDVEELDYESDREDEAPKARKPVRGARRPGGK